MLDFFKTTRGKYIMKKLQSLIMCSILGLVPALLSGCASIVNGTCQKIQVCTTPECGAQCYLQNNKGRWYIPCTPATVTIHRSYRDLVITAQKPGYEESVIRVKSRTKGMAFGNVVFGGAVGAGVDCADGAAYDYPYTIVIPMKPLSR